MKKRLFLTAGSLLILTVWITTGFAFAGADDIKSRMKTRLPVIEALKSQGIIGENNRGYLAFVGDQREKEAVVNAENEDRKIVYQALAKRENVPVERLEALRAKNLAAKADPGEWVQNASGEWYQK
jgi:uncharacterized protein YdbL (DUF1318 family)